MLEKPVKKWQPEVIDTQLSDSEAQEFEAEKPFILRVRDALFEQYSFRYNETRQILEFAPAEENDFIDFEHEHLNSIWIDFQLNKAFHKKEKPPITLLEKILYSRLVPKFNPIRSYFDALRWDGKDHIKTLVETVKVTALDLPDGKTTADYWPLMLRRWLISSAACGIGTGTNQVMLLFIGDQGTYKTTWMNRLCPPEIEKYAFTGHINPTITDNNTADLLAEKFIINLDDQLQSIFGKDFNLIKALITTTSVTNRKAYRRDQKKRIRIASFVGSVNSDRIFQDAQNRRYLTFKIHQIDITKKVDITQVWAQAYHLLKSGEKYWFDSEETAIIDSMNNLFTQVSEEEEWLVRLYRPVPTNDPLAKYPMFSEILSNLNAASGLRLSKYRLEIAMKKLGWENRTAKRIEGINGPRYVYAVYENFVKDSFGRIEVKIA